MQQNLHDFTILPPKPANTHLNAASSSHTLSDPHSQPDSHIDVQHNSNNERKPNPNLDANFFANPNH